MLSPTEQLKLMSGELSTPDADLQSLVLQIGAIKAHEFYSSYMLFPTVDVNDEPINELASSYLSKMLSTCDSIITGKGNIIALTRAMVVLIGGAVTLAQIEAATQAQWETFLDSKMIEAIELFSRVRQGERTAYNSLTK